MAQIFKENEVVIVAIEATIYDKPVKGITFVKGIYDSLIGADHLVTIDINGKPSLQRLTDEALIPLANVNESLLKSIKIATDTFNPEPIEAKEFNG